MISASITFDVGKALKDLGALGSQLHPTMLVAMRSFVQLVTTDTVKEKLSGQVLNRVTGGLQRSVVAAQKVWGQGDLVYGVVGVSKLSYGVWHEEGYSGPETIRAHQRRAHVRQMEGRAVNVRAHHVREHVANRNVPAKHFLQNTIREDTPQGEKRFARAVAILVRTGKIPNLPELRGA